jgi:hypothetical protein
MNDKVRLVLAIASALIVLAWTAGMYGLGWYTAGLKAELSQVSTDLQSERDMQAERDRLQADKDALQNDIDRMEKSHSEEMEHAQKTHDDVVADLRAGMVRVSIPVKTKACPSGIDGSASAPNGDQEARAELDPEAASTLEAIAFEGDQAIRDLNTVIDIYQRASALKCH